MANNSPTIVVASLSDDQLKKSIDALVTHVDEAMKKMVQSTNNAVGEMEAKLKSLGNLKIDSGGTADSRASKKATEQQKELEVQTKKTTQAAKEQAVSFDQYLQGLKQAMGVISNFNTLRQYINPSKQDYAEYERALARIVEYNDKLKQSALGKAFANEQSFAFDANRNIKDMFAVDERLKQLNKYYAEQEKMTAKRQALVDKEVAAYNDAMRKKEQSLASYTEKERASIEKYQDKVLKTAWRDALRMPTENIDQATAKIERIKSLISTLHPIGIISRADVDIAGATISKLEKRFDIQSAVNSELKKESAFANQSKQSLDALNAAVAQNTRNEDERRIAIIRSGLAAQVSLTRIKQNAQIELAENTGKPISGLKELAAAIREMERAYWDRSSYGKESPIGQSLKEDIEYARKLKTAIEAYNRALGGFSVENGKNGASNTLGSYTELSNILKTLSNEYRTLGREERNAAKGDELANKIQNLSRATQKMQQQMSRPINLSAALRGSEKTLDDIAYKIRRLQSYRQGIDLTKPNAANEIKQVDDAILKLQKDMDKYLGKSKDILNSNNALGRSWNYMKNRLAFYFTVGASTQFIKNLIEVRSQYEMNERALGILINSAERGTQIFNELSQMALVSPYTLIELSNAAKQLTAYDIAAKDVVDTTRRLADMASAVGVPMERLTYALGQIKAYGYLNSRDARMFANAGIPLVRELSKYYSELEGKVVSVGDVYTRMKKKAIDYNDVMAVVTKMTDEGGKFFDFQAKMAGTLKVQLANLSLAWNNMLNEIGSSEQGVLTGSIATLKNIFLHWRDLEGIIKKVVVAFGLFKAAQFTALAFTGDLTSAMAWQTLVGKRLQTTFSTLATSIKTSSIAIGAAGAAFWMLLAEGIMTYMKNAEEVERLNQSISDGAKESAKNLNEFLESAEIEQAKLSAQSNKLPKSDAEKTWEVLREQIELSSASANDIIPKLLQIKDLNERLTAAFELAEKVKKTNDKIGDLQNNLDFSQDTILGGLFGEGVIEDIEDYNEHLAYTIEREEYFNKKNHSFWENAVMGIKALFGDVKEDLGSSTNEAEDEIIRFSHNAAKAIKDNLGEEGLKDSIQINEAIARVLKGFEQQFPQIKGKGKMLFETIFNDVMAQEFNGAVDKQAYYYKLFLERLKKDHASAFQGVTDDILKETGRWSSGQENAIKNTAKKIKQDLPLAAQEAIDNILNQLNNTDFKLRIVTEFATTTLDDVQKSFRERFIEKDALGNTLSEKDQTERQQKYGSLMIKNNESDLEYQERIKKEKEKQLEISKSEGDIIAKNQGKSDSASKAIVARAEEAKKIADETVKSIGEIQSWGGYDFSTKKENAAASKAQKAAESELQKALKDELQLIDKVRSQYKKLTDAGASDGEALVMVTNQFANSLKHVNSVLGKNGIPLFDISKFAGTDNPNALLDMLKLQLDSAKVAKNIKPEEIKELEVKYSEIVVDAKAYNLTKITKGLNNELDRLKEEYELAVALDADPELGNMFANYMGINLEDLPKTAEEAAKKAQEYIDKILAENNSSEKIDISSLMDKKAFDSWVESSGHNLEDGLVKAVSAFRSYLHKVNVDETKNQAQEWNKLLEKYAEYEYKVTHIQKEAEREREVARKKGASQDVFDAINNRERQEIARVGFEKFQKSPEWIAATGDLANMSKSAIGMLIEELERYKRTAKNLSPKEIKQLNNALSKLYKEQRKNNPFKAVANMLDEAKERMSIFDDEIEETQKQIDELSKKHKTNLIDGIADDDTQKKLKETKEKLSKLKEERNNIGKIDASTWVSSINETISAVKSAIEVFDGLAKAIDGVENSDVDKVFSILDSAGKGASTGAAFGPYGAIIGGVVGAAAGVVNAFADVWSGNERINKSIEVSTQKVRALEREYKRLERAVDDAYGTDSIGAQRLMMLNKEAELAELERQLELEKSRKAKNKDQEKIDELRDKVDELRYEVNNAAREIILDLLEIGDAQDWANDFVKGMIDAFREGENYMKSYEDAFREMIDNMIAKTIAGKVIGERIEQMIANIKEIAKTRAEGDASVVAARDALDKLEQQRNNFYALREGGENVPEDVFDQVNKDIADAQKIYDEIYTKAVQPTPEDVQGIRESISSWKDDVKNEFDTFMEAFGVEFGSAKDSQQLSALQQGIQGVSEETAGAVEAYLNGMSQQAYLRNELLTQIRDAIMGTNSDIQLGVQGQMLLQLQNNYIIMQSIQSMMEGWTTPSGQGIRVELIS